MSHGSARLTVYGRLLIVQRHQQGWKQAHIAAAMGISRKCVKTWLDRYAAEGESGLVTRSSRPHSTPTRTSADIESEVVAVRRAQRCGREEISARTGVAARTVSRILARHQMPPLKTLDPITGQVIRASKLTAVRYERSRPGELAHMDVKKLARIPAGGGWRGRGEPVSNHASKKDKATKVGYDYVHSLVDDYTRLTYSEVLRDEQGTTCAGFLTRAADYFAAHGIVRIEELMTDNAWAYKYSLRDVCAELGIRQIFIKAHCPWQNGKVERINRTLLVEWAYRRVYLNNHDRTAALAPWLEYYNTQRRHSALGGLPPISRLRPT
jgi:transposase InsO family protein